MISKVLAEVCHSERCAQCQAAVPQRFEAEVQNLARLTGWDIATVREKMASNGQAFEVKPDGKLKWYQKLWKK